MVTFAQAQERAEEWVNGDVPAYQHREVRVREFGLGFGCGRRTVRTVRVRTAAGSGW